MVTATRLPCHLCPHWVESAIIGRDAAAAKLAEHVRTAHPAATFPPESKLFALPPGSVQSDTGALDARAAVRAGLAGPRAQADLERAERLRAHPAAPATPTLIACEYCAGRGWNVGECHPQEVCGGCNGSGTVTAVTAPAPPVEPPRASTTPDTFLDVMTMCYEGSRPGELWREYQAVLNDFCTRFSVPGAPTLREAVEYVIKTRLTAAPVAAPFTATIHCHNATAVCHTPVVCETAGKCDAQRPAPAPIRSWSATLTFNGEYPDVLVEKVRAWLADMDRASDPPVPPVGDLPVTSAQLRIARFGTPSVGDPPQGARALTDFHGYLVPDFSTTAAQGAFDRALAGVSEALQHVGTGELKSSPLVREGPRSYPAAARGAVDFWEHYARVRAAQGELATPGTRARAHALLTALGFSCVYTTCGWNGQPHQRNCDAAHEALSEVENEGKAALLELAKVSATALRDAGAPATPAAQRRPAREVAEEIAMQRQPTSEEEIIDCIAAAIEADRRGEP